MLDVLSAVLFLAIGFHFLRFLYHWITQSDSEDWNSLGKWAVVTGATDGIGKAFAEFFAAKGLDVVLVSRSQSKLLVVSEELVQKYGVSTRIVQADFSSTDEKMYCHIKDEINELDIGILVNNVGISYPHPEYFLELRKNHQNLYTDIINCNITSMINMCRFVLPGMVARGRGRVINLSSGLGDIPGPLLTLYAATKSFISKFSHDLDIEYRHQGVKVQWLKPGLVATNMSQFKKTSWYVPSPTTYVKNAISELSVKTCSEGYFAHSLIHNTILLFHSFFPSYTNKKLLNTMLATRKKGLKKCKLCNVPDNNSKPH